MFRILATAITINQHFRRLGSIIKLYPLHPDKCGGTGDVGLLLSNMLLIIAVAPIWITIDTYFMCFLVSGGSQMIYALGVYALYIVIVPVILFSLLWQPHKAMEFFKSQQLLDISKRLLELQDQLTRKIREKDWDGLKNLQDNYKQLQDIYNTLDKQIPIWPISLPTVRNFGAIASSPIMVGLITFGVDLLGKYTHW
jgi:hypothetical protein